MKLNNGVCHVSSMSTSFFYHVLWHAESSRASLQPLHWLQSISTFCEFCRNCQPTFIFACGYLYPRLASTMAVTPPIITVFPASLSSLPSLTTSNHRSPEPNGQSECDSRAATPSLPMCTDAMTEEDSFNACIVLVLCCCVAGSS